MTWRSFGWIEENHPEIAHFPKAQRDQLRSEVTFRLFRRPSVWLLIATSVLVSAVPLLTLRSLPNALPLPVVSVGMFACHMVVNVGIVLVIFRLRRHTLRDVLRDRQIRPATCFGCGYDLRATPGDLCPECGQFIECRPRRVTIGAGDGSRLVISQHTR